MSEIKSIKATTDHSRFDNAIIGTDTLIEPDVELGWRYHKNCGKSYIGEKGIFRKGTIVYGDVTIGDFFQSGHYSVIRAKVEIGNYCCLSNHSTLEGIIRMGDGVRIMSHTYIPSRTWFGNHIFIGPGVTFLNDRFPGRSEKLETPKGARIKDEVVIGGGCIILPGVSIGEGSFIAAGATVTKDVPPKSLVVGTPGRIKPLPEKLVRSNNRALTIQPVDLWHPHMDIDSACWPDEWKS